MAEQQDPVYSSNTREEGEYIQRIHKSQFGYILRYFLNVLRTYKLIFIEQKIQGIIIKLREAAFIYKIASKKHLLHINIKQSLKIKESVQINEPVST